ncbi:MAG: hypothetical protein NZ935_11955 [Planctomycetes bacterium]|nr:hypothetical protein [Planctomycetota bacterium]
MKSSGYFTGISLLLTFTLGAGFLYLDSAPAGNGQASAQEEKHGGDIIFEVKKNKQKLGHSIFSHQLHLDSGSTCKDCHNDKVFKRERKIGNNKFTMKDIMEGKACGACHNGRTVIKNKTIFHPKNNCKRCHSATFRKKRR